MISIMDVVVVVVARGVGVVAESLVVVVVVVATGGLGCSSSKRMSRSIPTEIGGSRLNGASLDSSVSRSMNQWVRSELQ